MVERIRAFGSRKIVWIPLTVFILAAGSLVLANYEVMRDEPALFEIGQSIRGRFDDFSHDFATGDRATISSYLADSFSGGDFGFEKRKQISDENGIRLEEWQATPSATSSRDQMLEALLAYRHQLHDTDSTKFKMVFLNRYTDRDANVLMRVQNYGHDDAGHPTEDRGHFDVDLVRQDGEWKMTSMKLVSVRRVVGVDSKYFTDVTAEAGIDFNTGVNDIFQQQRYNFAIVDRAAGGVATGDYDNDGYPDIVFAGSEGSSVYHNTGKGTFENVTEKAGLGGEIGRHGQGVVMADYNNDGCLDIFITKTPNVTNRL